MFYQFDKTICWLGSSGSGDEEEEGSESGEVESSSNEESSDDDTASEQAENTPGLSLNQKSSLLQLFTISVCFYEEKQGLMYIIFRNNVKIDFSDHSGTIINILLHSCARDKKSGVKYADYDRVFITGTFRLTYYFISCLLQMLKIGRKIERLVISILSLVEHEDEQDEEAEEAEVASATEVEPSKNEGKWKTSERSSRRSTYSDGQSRTPSRSPTPRRRSDDEDTMEARWIICFCVEASNDAMIFAHTLLVFTLCVARI